MAALSLLLSIKMNKETKNLNKTSLQEYFLKFKITIKKKYCRLKIDFSNLV